MDYTELRKETKNLYIGQFILVSVFLAIMIAIFVIMVFVVKKPDYGDICYWFMTTILVLAFILQLRRIIGLKDKFDRMCQEVGASTDAEMSAILTNAHAFSSQQGRTNLFFITDTYLINFKEFIVFRRADISRLECYDRRTAKTNHSYLVYGIKVYTYSNKYMEMVFRDKSQRDQIHALLSGAVVQ